MFGNEIDEKEKFQAEGHTKATSAATFSDKRKDIIKTR